jgi:hypothetical protein
VRTADAKLIWRRDGRPSLYDLRADPNEHHDRMCDATPPRGPLRRLAKLMRSLGEEAGDGLAIDAAERILAATAQSAVPRLSD